MPARKEKAAMRSRIGAARERWEREVLSPVIAKSPERRKRFESTSGEAIERLYTPQGPEPFDYLGDAGSRGSIPSPGAGSRRCTGDASGRCGNSRASAMPGNRTGGTATC